jgi:hypothetical protein
MQENLPRGASLLGLSPTNMGNSTMDGLPDSEGITLDYFPHRSAAGGEVLISFLFDCNCYDFVCSLHMVHRRMHDRELVSIHPSTCSISESIQ